jgi:hypothetical protein
MTSDSCKKKTSGNSANTTPQKLLIFQQNGSAESKIKGIEKYGDGCFFLQVISIDTPLPPIIDDTSTYLPEDFSADLVLDFLQHPDLSHDLSRMCQERKIPIVSSGKKIMNNWIISPPT